MWGWGEASQVPFFGCSGLDCFRVWAIGFRVRVSSRHLLGGPWVVKSGVISPLTRVTSIVTLLMTPLITTHEPPSS